MIPLEKSTNATGLQNFPAPEDKKRPSFLGRVDLVALLTALFCLCLFGFLAAAMAVIQLVELISSLWSNSFDRCLIAALGVALAWVAVRWKKLCVF